MSDDEFVRETIERLERENDVLRQQLRHERTRSDFFMKLLSGIHGLLYPPAVTLEDGRTIVFRPKDPSPHETLQALSDRIRALPDQLAKAPT